ncbi:hypothetical protein CARN8_350003 [mine drainage metagenome]|uniref:Uncharacterized protein n=1 Tax=mine drainage metagenome TaxID=410659 RepID=A0A3P3ZP50_9ZZZZ
MCGETEALQEYRKSIPFNNKPMEIPF